jgi:rhodanese-related sulfurtransferase
MIPTIGAQELWARLQQGKDLLLVDVRSQMEYDDTHLPGAINLAWEREEDILEQAVALGLSKAREIVAYCSSPI